MALIYADGNAQVMDGWFRQSKLYRQDKWGEREITDATHSSVQLIQ